MDWRLQIREALEKRVFDRACEVLGLEVGLLFFDITSTYFVTEEADAPVGRDEYGNPVPDGAESADAASRTATGRSFTPVNVATIRKRHGIPACQDRDDPDPDGEVMSVHQAAAELGITASTLYRWLNDGFVPGEQITPGAPWRIRLTGSIRKLIADDAPAGWVPVQAATASLGVSRQTVLQCVKRGELRAVHIRAGRRKGLRIELPAPQDGLF